MAMKKTIEKPKEEPQNPQEALEEKEMNEKMREKRKAEMIDLENKINLAWEKRDAKETHKLLGIYMFLSESHKTNYNEDYKLTK